MISVCPKDKGKASKNAIAWSFWLIILAEIFPSTILQKVQFVNIFNLHLNDPRHIYEILKMTRSVEQIILQVDTGQKKWSILIEFTLEIYES